MLGDNLLSVQPVEVYRLMVGLSRLMVGLSARARQDRIGATGTRRYCSSPFTTYSGRFEKHTRARALNLIQAYRLNIVHLAIVRAYCRVLKARVSQRRKSQGSCRGGKILGEGGSLTHPGSCSWDCFRGWNPPNWRIPVFTTTNGWLYHH